MTQLETTAEVITKASPPLAVVTAQFAGLDIPALVQQLTLVYLVLLIAHKAFRIWREWHRGRSTDDTDE